MSQPNSKMRAYAVLYNPVSVKFDMSSPTYHFSPNVMTRSTLELGATDSESSNLDPNWVRISSLQPTNSDERDQESGRAGVCILRPANRSDCYSDAQTASQGQVLISGEALECLEAINTVREARADVAALKSLAINTPTGILNS